MGRRKSRLLLGMIIGSVGIGMVITVLVPVWGWLIVIGGALIYLGWCIMNRCR